jgi:hypothetical protein
MCRALKVLCAAPDRDRLSALKRASVGVAWELVGGAASLQELPAQLGSWRPDVVVLDASLGTGALDAVHETGRSVRVVSVGELPGSDAVVGSLAEVRDAILGVPRPGGPVRA